MKLRHMKLVLYSLTFLLGISVGCQLAPPPPTANGSVIPKSVQPIVSHLIATSHPAAAAVVQSVPGAINAVTSTPKDLKGVATWLDIFIVLGVLAGGTGIGVAIASTTLRKIAVVTAGGGLGLLGMSLLVRTTLWLFPYVGGALLLASAGLLLYEYIRNRSLIDADVTSGLTKTQTSSGHPTPFPELASKTASLAPKPAAVVNIPSAVAGVVTTEVGKIETEVKDVAAKV